MKDLKRFIWIQKTVVEWTISFRHEKWEIFVQME